MKLGNFKPLLEFKTFCSACGKEVPFKKKYFIKLYQIHPRVVGESYRIFIGYVCPDDGTTTETNRPVKNDCTAWMNKFNLYTDTRKHNTL